MAIGLKHDGMLAIIYEDKDQESIEEDAADQNNEESNYHLEYLNEEEKKEDLNKNKLDHSIDP